MPTQTAFDHILHSFRKPQPLDHVPRFSIRQSGRGYSLLDHDRQIAYVNTDEGFYIDLWSFSPFEPDVFANESVHPHVWDMHTRRNSFINLPCAHAADMLPPGETDPFPRMRVSWPEASGDRLRCVIEGRFPEGQRLLYEIRLRYEPDWGRYRCFVHADAWKLRPEGFEPINFMMAGALRGRSRSRWSHSVYEDKHHALRRLVHSSALFFATDYACPRGTTRRKSMPTEKAWIAYALDETCNPAMLIHECNVPMFTATCSQLFDEHLIWYDATLEELEENLFHLRMHTEFVNLGHDLAAGLLQAAVDPPRPAAWRHERVPLPFRLETENDLETPLDVWAQEDCPVLGIPLDDPSIRWADDEARSGRRSIRLQGERRDARAELSPCGAVCEADLGARYRFSAWVKTQNVERFARLQLATYEYTNANVINVGHSAKLSGDNDWTLLCAETENDISAYAMPALQLHGKGTAWFDDLKYERVG